MRSAFKRVRGGAAGGCRVFVFVRARTRTRLAGRAEAGRDAFAATLLFERFMDGGMDRGW